MAILDQYGNPLKFDRQAMTQEIAAPSSTGVRRHAVDHPSVGITPARLANLLRSAESTDPRQYLALAEDMEEKELQYLTTLGTRKRAVCQLEITVEPGGDSQADEDNAQLVRDWLSRDTLEDELFDVLDAVGKGFSLTEIIWETSERQWMPARLEWVDPTFVEFDRVDLKTPYLKSEGGPQPLPAYKFIDFRLKAKSGIPIRGGLARPVSWAYLFKNFDIKGWVQFMEVYGQPLRVGKYGSGASDEEKRTLLRAVRDVGADAAAVIPSGMEIEFIKDTSSKGGDGHRALADYMDQQISKVVLGQTTTTDAISGGHAVSQEHNDVRGDIERADAKALAAVLNLHLVKPLIDLNAGPQGAYPKIRIGKPDSVDIAAFTEAVDKVSRHMELSKSQVRGKLGLKAPESADDAFGGSAQRQDRSMPGGTPAQARRAMAQEEAPRDVVDDMTRDTLDEEWEELMDPMLDPVREAVENAGSYEEVKEALAAQFEDMGDEAVQNLLARMGFNIRLAAGLGAIDTDDETEG